MNESLFLKACNNEVTSRPPIWFMRQAGRYLPEYRALRKNYSFVDMIHNPNIVLDVTLQPIKRFGFDAAILYSDILTISEYFNIHFKFVEKKGPVLVESGLTLSELVQQFETPTRIESLQCVYDSIVLLKKELSSVNIPLIGFAGSPFTVACYLIEKQSSKTFSTVFDVIKKEPKLFKRLLSSLTSATIVHLREQIKHGVQAIQLFDTWGSILSGTDYATYSLNSLRTIINALKPESVPITLYSKNSQTLIKDLTSLDINVLSIDWNSSAIAIKESYPNLVIQGNLDPNLLCTNVTEALNATKRICKSMSNKPGFIFNLGHGILPTTPLENVNEIVSYVKSL